MRNRFTYESRTERGRISQETRLSVFARDRHYCQYCGNRFDAVELTIDHLVPLAAGGLDEVTNYVSACRPCNERKAATPLVNFAASINIAIESLPVHGDPVINNERLPVQIRLLRKRIFDSIRSGDLSAGGRAAQRKIEKHFRMAFWDTDKGKQLEASFPSLPGHVRIMIPEIQTVAKNQREYLLLIELAKSANTRSLIGDILGPDTDVESVVRKISTTTNDGALGKRLGQALRRFEAAVSAAADW